MIEPQDLPEDGDMLVTAQVEQSLRIRVLRDDIPDDMCAQEYVEQRLWEHRHELVQAISDNLNPGMVRAVACEEW